MTSLTKGSAPAGDAARGAGGVTRDAVPAANSSTVAAAGNPPAAGPMLTLPAPLAALAEEPTFCLYKTAPSATKPGKLDKRPCNYLGEVADANDPRNHMTADLACQWAAHYGPPYGVAKVFPPGGRFFFLDIDHCMQDDGQWSPLAQTLMQRLTGCAIEVSASGRGLHIFGRGPVPEHGCRNTALGLELYTEGRFVALTGTGAVGDAGHTPPPDVWQWLVPTYFPPRAGGAGGDRGAEWTDGPCPEWRGPTDDADLLRRAMRSQSGKAALFGKASFSDLWEARTDVLANTYPADASGSGQYNASSADAALAQHLAFWTGRDCARIERLMRQSALARQKWDDREDYLPRTVLNAVAGCRDVLVEREPPPGLMTAPPGDYHLASLIRQLPTQDSVAELVIHQNRDNWLYDHTGGRWLKWDGSKWATDATREIEHIVRLEMRARNLEGSATKASNSFLQGTLAFLRSDPAWSRQGSDFDGNNYLLNTPGVTYDLLNMQGWSNRPGDMLTMCTSVAPTAEGGARFRQFLSEVTLGDPELQTFLQVALGACLSGAVESHWMLFWRGIGRNGKNTLGDLVQDVMGSYARKIPSATLMARKHEGHPTELASLKGVRLAVSSEVADGAHWNEARINELTGDKTIAARWMNGNFFEFERTHKHLIYGNHRPQMRSCTEAVKSRIKIVPFNACFAGREDPDLPATLRKEGGYVLHWLMEGHRLWIEGGRKLPRCKAVEDESADYFQSQSSVDAWMSERLEMLPDDPRPGRDLPTAGSLYSDFKQWKFDRGEHAESQTRFGEALRGVHTLVKVMVSGRTHYRGAKLKPPANHPWQ